MNLNGIKVIIDGSNVAWTKPLIIGGRKFASLNNITKIWAELESLGCWDTETVVDAGLWRQIYEKDEFEEYKNRGKINQAPSKKSADEFIIDYARRKEAMILSNDNFDEYRAEDPWVLDRINSRILRFMFISDIVKISPLARDELENLREKTPAEGRSQELQEAEEKGDGRKRILSEDCSHKLSDYGLSISDRKPLECEFEGDEIPLSPKGSEYVSPKFNARDRIYGVQVEDIQVSVYEGKYGTRVRIICQPVGDWSTKGCRPVPGWDVKQTGWLSRKELSCLAKEFIEGRFCERRTTEE